MPATFLVDPKNTFEFTAAGYATISTDTTTDSAAVDCLDAEGYVFGLVQIGDSGDASTTITLSLIESDASAGTYSEVDGSEVALAASATANDTTYHVLNGHLRTLRYVKVRIVTAGGGTPAVPVATAVVWRKKIAGTGNGAQV